MQNFKLKTAQKCNLKWLTQIYTTIKKSAVSSTYNACKVLGKEIHSLCWYNAVNQILKSMEQVICFCLLSQEISSLTVVFIKPFLQLNQKQDNFHVHFYKSVPL